MATFGTLRTRLRNDVLAETDTNFYSDADLLNFLVEASIELSALGGFPVATSQSTLLSSATTITAPSDINYVVSNYGVVVNNFPLREKDWQVVQLFKNNPGQTRYYNYDSRKGGAIEIAPATSSSVTAVVRYVQDLSGNSYSASDTPWNGVLSNWQDCIVYLAGVKAFERSLEYDKAQYWKQRLLERLQSFSAYLEDDSILSLAQDRPTG